MMHRRRHCSIFRRRSFRQLPRKRATENYSASSARFTKDSEHARLVSRVDIPLQCRAGWHFPVNYSSHANNPRTAVDSLLDSSAVDTLLSNFIIPLQSDDISKPDVNGIYRVHCSLNINTETGRLSARRPNLQNQPALEKDRYKVGRPGNLQGRLCSLWTVLTCTELVVYTFVSTVQVRKAFTANVQAGNALLVADYGQLELRLLAHMADCKSMQTAFELGGDFHSRTALGMYDHIQDAIAKGKWTEPVSVLGTAPTSQIL